MTFDGTITLGNLLSVLSIVAAIIALYLAAMRRIDKLEMKVRLMWSHFTRQMHSQDNEEE